MKIHTDTEQVIAGLLNVPLVQSLDARQRHLYRESLRSLVRLAKSEQMMDMKMSIRKLMGANAIACYIERPRKSRGAGTRQQQFEFK